MQQYVLELDYSVGVSERTKKIKCVDSFENEDVVLMMTNSLDKSSSCMVKKIRLNPKVTIKIHSAKLIGQLSMASRDTVFINGFQSWTDSHEQKGKSRIRGISPIAKPLIRRYELDRYGDYTFVDYSRKKGIFHGFTYGYTRSVSIDRTDDSIVFYGSLSEKVGYTYLEFNTNTKTITLSKDIKGIALSSEVLLFDLFFAQGAEDVVFDRYFLEMNIDKPKVPKMNGWTSWYNYYETISEDIILHNLDGLSRCKVPLDIFQIDDGYQCAVGDWLTIKEEKFPNGMKSLVDKIHSKGFKAGLWLAPFVCETKSQIYIQKKEWLLKDHEGNFVCGGSNWSKFYALDIYNEEVRAYLKRVFHQVTEIWGFDLVKLDFLYAISLIPYKNRSRGQIMCDGMEFIRECVKDTLILGCGVPLGAAFGKVDYCRVGCDMGLDWNGSRLMQLLHRERVSTLNSMLNAIYRRQLDGRGFMNDPDVFLLRENNIHLTKSQKELLAMVNHIFGSLIFSSDDVTTYDREQQTFFEHVMKKATIVINHVHELRTKVIQVAFIEDLQPKSIVLNLTHKKYMFNKNIVVKPYSYYIEEK